ncbi:MAG: YbhB/YbcL family Raf kinase inhibitor-like protein [Alphaproteobacteria bacterium]|nr:YbhB/YbcL family Raf kinase inhibitor-like protein [Alphaproteobacteria bacterium]
MYLVSDSFAHLAWIPEAFAFGKHHATDHFTFAGNRNPHLRWGDVPAATKSFAVLCYDDDVPSRGDDVNQEGKVVPADLPRVRFWHWILLDVPADVRQIAAGAFADGVTPHGKPADHGPYGTPGINDYTGWFAGAEGMKGQYYGYDGPAPPWNDSRVHAYRFEVLALDVVTTGMHGSFDGAKAWAALDAHVLDKATHVGLYAINPAARAAHAATLA